VGRVVFKHVGGVGKSGNCRDLAAIGGMNRIRNRGVALAVVLWLASVGGAAAGLLPGEQLRQLPQSWPPAGWSLGLSLPDQPAHESQARLGNGYFGQALYRHISGTSDYWTANVLIRDRGSDSSAWRAVSAVNCNSRMFQGYRARECVRGDRRYLTKTMHYQVGRYYVTIQLAGPGDTEYPQFELGAGGGFGRSPLGSERRERRSFWDF